MLKVKNSLWRQIAYILQGGGALGAYQVGVFEGLHEAGYRPDRVCGISIGSINAAIIAGNKPKNRVAKLKEFWHAVETKNLIDTISTDDFYSRKVHNFLSAQSALIFGQPNFFIPREINPLLLYDTTPDHISFYRIEPLRKTLLQLVDFDLLNKSGIRLSLGATCIRTSEATYFDNTEQTISVDHILASGAMPPGFPAIKIGKEYYWDGGLVTNTPLEFIMDAKPRISTLCFMLNLFAVESDSLPSTFEEVQRKVKDLQYSSRFKRTISTHELIHALRLKINKLYELLPDDKRDLPEVKEMSGWGCKTRMTLVRFQRPHSSAELSSKDYEFSQLSIEEAIKHGNKHAEAALEISPWKQPYEEGVGVRMFDLYDTLID